MPGTPASQLFYAALRKAGVTLGPGRTPSASQYEEARTECNRMLGGWNIQKLDIFTTQIQLFALGTKKTYTIGKDPVGVLTADFDADRPAKIERANLILPASPTLVRLPLHVMNDQEWAQIRVQDLPNTIPVQIYNDGNYPFSTIYFWGQPPGGYQFEMFSWQAIQTFQTLTDQVLLPSGYEDAIVLNLAVRLGAMPWPIEKPMSADVVRQAQKAKAAIESRNAPTPRLSTDAPASGKGAGYYNYRLGVNQ